MELATGAVAGAAAAVACNSEPVAPELAAPEPVTVELAGPERAGVWASCAEIFGAMVPGSKKGHRQRAQLGTNSSRYKVPWATFSNM